MTDTHSQLSLVVVSAGISAPSSTRLLADRIAQKTVDSLQDQGRIVATKVIELGPIALDIAQALVSGHPSDGLQPKIKELAAADGVIAATPVYTAGVSGLFKSFCDVLDTDLIVATPTLLSGTGGSSRHALVIEDQLRPTFSYLRALTVPTSVYAAPEDWSAPALGERIGRAATELAALMASGVAKRIADQAWAGYQHRFAGNATRAEQTAADIDFDSPLMRLAAGGDPIRKDRTSGT
ncbi:CE1759 family FMN reductase [Streptomyces sp. Ag109_O5-10]|uniref:CE1759 family FMN reductase n=1 Tax=Streptomyces sp. Ag109_O5-10 TaxID=1855349 RepID=UPI000897FCBF|nr:CE1759 family FMN reductase [Streptomyces sp. Ag109_O5-10]SED62854.1 FMN reductase [Streptomyces sp. Ag109_O5-10]